MRLAVAALVVAAAVGRSAGCDPAAPVRVTVVVIFATSAHRTVDPKLEGLAAEVRKRGPDLTGFKLAETLPKDIAVGDAHTFDLPDKQTMRVAVDRPRDKDDRVGLTIGPPGVGEISYSCVCNKFLPVVTPHKLPSGERLIVAIRAAPGDRGK